MAAYNGTKAAQNGDTEAVMVNLIGLAIIFAAVKNSPAAKITSDTPFIDLAAALKKTSDAIQNLVKNLKTKLSPEALVEKGLPTVPDVAPVPELVGFCFAAGTLVHTKNGLVPIEKICVGELVLSQPEEKGQVAYRPVVNKFVHEDKEIFLVQYSCANGTRIDNLVATGYHPFWVKDIGWTAVIYLEANHLFELHDGSAAIVQSVRKVHSTQVPHIGWAGDQDGNTGVALDLRNDSVQVADKETLNLPALEIGESLKTRVFNIEIDGFHTYYAGDAGVWVHNANCSVADYFKNKDAAPLEPTPIEPAPAEPASAPGEAVPVEDTCFAAGTLVHTKEGLKPIEDVKVGDWVLSWPEDKPLPPRQAGPSRGRLPEEYIYRQVTQTFVHENQRISHLTYMSLADGVRETLRVTPNHPIWVKYRGWTKVINANGGHVLETAAFGNVVLLKLKHTEETVRVFNIEVDGFHTYYVGDVGIWVHNKDNAPGEVTKIADLSANNGKQVVFKDPNFDNSYTKNSNQITNQITEPLAQTYMEQSTGIDFTEIVRNASDNGPDLVGFVEPSGNNPGQVVVLDTKGSRVGSFPTLQAIQLGEKAPGWIMEGANLGKIAGQDISPAAQLVLKDAMDLLNGKPPYKLVTGVVQVKIPNAGTIGPMTVTYVPNPLNLQDVPIEGVESAPSLTQSEANSLLSAAEQFWLNAGASSSLLHSLSVGIGNLPAGVAAQTVGTQITLSANGAGWGWYVDPNPSSEADFTATGNPNEFTAVAGSAAAGKLDLLTVLIHEMGHVLGLPDVSDNEDVMGQYLTPGVRRLPSADDIAQMLAASAEQLDSTGSATAGIFQTIVNPPPAAAPQSGPYVVGPIAATLANGSFANSLTGWAADGTVTTDSNGNAILANSASADAQLAQTFDVTSSDRYLEFTVANGLQTNGANGGTGPEDAFDVALDDADTGASLVGTDGLTDTDGLLNIQADGTTSVASSVTTIANANGTTTYVINLQDALGSGAVNGTPATLSFDLVGFDGTQSQVALSNIQLVQTPLAFNDNASTPENASITINPMAANPTGSGAGDGAGAVVQIVQEPAHGALTQNADGSYSYVPDTNFFGSDSFQYSYTADGETSNVATVNIAVNEVAYPPTGVDSSANVTAGKPYTFNPLAGADDINGNPMTAVLDTPPADGTLVVNADGTWTYTPSASYTGPDSLVYHLSDGLADSAPLTASFTVLPAHHAPVAHSGVVQVQEDGSLSINLASYGTDIDGNPITGSVTAQPAHGTLTQNADGTYTYTPAAGYYGQDSLSFVVSDAYLSSQQATLSLDVTPILANNNLNVSEDSSVVFNPVASQNAGAPLTASIVAQPANGTITVNADGTWTYTPNVPFYGSDSFSYQVNDGADNSNVATVNLTVVHPAPVLNNANANLNEDGSLNLNLAANASDVPGYKLSTQIITQPANGTITQNPDGTWTYTPNQYFFGADSFSYLVNDGVDNSNVATVTLTVNKVEIAPTLANSNAMLNEDGSANLNLLASATDVNGDPVTASIVSQPAHGTVTQNANGTWTYTPNQYFFGTDTFTYSVSDGTDSSNVATLTLTVNKVEIAPTLVNSNATLNEDGSANLNLLASATDVNGDPVTATIFTQPANGTVTQNANGTWTYTPNQYFFGTDTFTYSVSDGVDSSNVATVTLNVNKVEIAPTLANSNATLNEDGSANLNLLASATDVNGDPVTASIVSQPAHGTVTQNADGTWTYTPNQYFYGTDTFTYLVSDGTDSSNVATVTLTVNKVEIAPTLANSSATLNEDGSANLNLLASATDVNGDPVTASVVTQPAHGTVTQNAGGTWTYTPNQYFFGTDTFTYSVSDGTDSSNVATVTLTVNKVEIAPTLANSTVSLNEDSSTTLNPLSSATDVNGVPLTAAVVTQPAHGAITVNANGTWTYTPNQYFFGTDTFTYSVSDGTDSSNVATVTLNVDKVEIAPTLTNSSAALNEDGSANLNLLASATDANGGPLTAAIVTQPANGAVTQNANGTWTYTPNLGFSGTDTFTYEVSDGVASSNVATVTLSVAAIAPPSDIDLGIAGQFNAFAFNNFTANGSDVQGAVAVGNNFSASSYSIDAEHEPYQGLSLVVGNQLDFTGGAINGEATYGGTQQTSNLSVGDSVVKAAPPFSFAATQSTLQKLSAGLANLPATGTVTAQYGGLTFTGNGSAGVQVFNLTGAELESASYSNFAGMTAGQTVIVNVSGDSGFTGGTPNGFQNYNTLFNFSTATSLSFNGVGVYGSILAPYATVNGGNGQINGNVVVDNWNSSVQINANHLFQATSLIQQAPTASNSQVTGTENTPLVLQWSNFAVANPTV